MATAVQITLVVCGTIVVLFGMLMLMAWLGSKKK